MKAKVKKWFGLVMIIAGIVFFAKGLGMLHASLPYIVGGFLILSAGYGYYHGNGNEDAQPERT